MSGRFLLPIFLGFGLAASAQTAVAPGAPAATQMKLPDAPLLPESFGAWKQTAPAMAPKSSLSGDSAEDKEFGLQRSATATYKQPGKGGTLTIAADQMMDATGAYSAFTLTRKGMGTCANAAKLGEDCALGPGRMLFWNGATLVSVHAEGGEGIHLSELKDLVAALPKPSGTKAQGPVLPRRLPIEGLDRDSIRYAVGPSTYTYVGSPVPEGAVDFSKSPEVITAKYAGHASGNGTLTIVYYPTPQIAGDRSRAYEAAMKDAHVSIKRVATMVVIASAFPHTQADAMVNRVTTNEQFTFNKSVAYEPPGGQVKETVTVLSKIIIFVIVMTLAALVLGVFFGGGRALYRTLRGKPASSLEDMEFIKLELGGKPRTKLHAEAAPEPISSDE